MSFNIVSVVPSSSEQASRISILREELVILRQDHDSSVETHQSQLAEFVTLLGGADGIFLDHSSGDANTEEKIRLIQLEISRVELFSKVL